ncbi:MAG: hypothetical protein P8M30_10095 [Planctomycetaceae bacterium]|nr:hypothetical protein [Planctomycetaceae bacterium]
MNCDELKHQLEAAVEARTPLPIIHWREHLGKCDACRSACEDHQLLDHAVEEWTSFEDSPDLTEQILAILDGDEPPKFSTQRLGRSRIPLITVLATSVVVLIVLFNKPKATQDDSPTMLVNGPAVNENHLVTSESVDLEQVILETRNAYESLLGQAQSTIAPLKAAIADPKHEQLATHDQSLQGGHLQFVPAELEPLKEEFTQSVGFLTALFPERGSR